MSGATGWRFVHFGLVVTGKGEFEFLPDFFKAIMAASGRCTFQAIDKPGQRQALSQKRITKYSQKGKTLPSKDEDVGLLILRYASNLDHFVIWIDDLESADRYSAKNKLGRLLQILDDLMHDLPDIRRRCSAHFLVNMLEAYYFADANAINQVNFQRDPSRPPFYPQFTNHDGDCENIRHPKNELKDRIRQSERGASFDERLDGASIVKGLDLERILVDSQKCRALRTLVAWCWEAIGEPRTDRFRLTDGVYWNVTAGQLQHQPEAHLIGELGNEEGYRPSPDQN